MTSITHPPSNSRLTTASIMTFRWFWICWLALRPWIASRAFPILDAWSESLLMIVCLGALFLPGAGRRLGTLMHSRHQHIIWICWGLWGVATVAACLNSIDLGRSWDAMRNVMWSGALMLMPALLCHVPQQLDSATPTDWEPARHVTLALLASGSLIALLAIHQWHTGFSTTREFLVAQRSWVDQASLLGVLDRRRSFGPFFSPGLLASCAVLLIALALVSRRSVDLTPYRPDARTHRLAYTIVIAFLVTALLCSQSLIGWITLCTVVLLIWHVGIVDRRRIIVPIMLGVALIGAVGVVWFRHETLLQLSHTEHPLVQRWSYWTGATELWLRRPWFGWGPNTFGLAYLQVKPPMSTGAAYAHQAWLHVAAERGLFGAVPLLALCLTWWWNFRPHRPLQNRHELLQAGWWVALTSFWIYNLADYSFWVPELGYVWWTGVGLFLYQPRLAASPVRHWQRWTLIVFLSVGVLDATRATWTFRQWAHVSTDHPQVAHRLEQAMAWNPWSAEAAHRLGDHLNPHNPSQALPFYQRSIQLSPANPYYRRDLARTLDRLGRHDEARQALQAGQRLYPSHPGWSK